MGKYIVLEVNDMKAAGAIEALLARADMPEEFDANTLGIMLGAHASVLAVFLKPSVLCTCGSTEQSVRGRKFGWWVCPTCKRARSRNGNLLRNWLNEKLRGTTRIGSPTLHVSWGYEDDRVKTISMD